MWKYTYVPFRGQKQRRQREWEGFFYVVYILWRKNNDESCVEITIFNVGPSSFGVVTHQPKPSRKIETGFT